MFSKIFNLINGRIFKMSDDSINMYNKIYVNSVFLLLEFIFFFNKLIFYNKLEAFVYHQIRILWCEKNILLNIFGETSCKIMVIFLKP